MRKSGRFMSEITHDGAGWNRRALLLAGGAAVLVGGCGGDDGGSATPPVASPPPTPTPSPASPPTASPAPGSANLAVATENWSNAAFVAEGGASISASIGQDVAVDGTTIRLRRVTLPNPGSLIRYAPARTPFVAGRTYLISFYALIPGGGDAFVWSRQVEFAGHEPKWLTGEVRRVWWTVRAANDRSVAPISVPAAAPAGNPGQGMPVLLFRGSFAADPVTLLVGGLQIEEIPDSSPGIALIGDSTQNLDSNLVDAQAAITPAKWLAGALNLPVYNRAISGNTTGNMLARWSADMTPLAASSRWAVIQGGGNDVHRGVSFAAARDNFAALVARAGQDGFVPVACTITPTHLATSDRRPVRDDLNNWIRATFPRVIDLDAVMRDPVDPQRLLAAYSYDGTHYTTAGSKAAGLAMATPAFWTRQVPGPYRSVA